MNQHANDTGPALEDTTGGSLDGRDLDPLAELVLECLLALPQKAAEIWRHVPVELFTGSVGSVLYESVNEELAGGAISAVRLARELTDSDANRVVLKLLSRLEEASSRTEARGEREGYCEEEYEIIWENCLRDLRRWRSRFQLKELAQKKVAAQRDGNTEAYRRYRDEYSQLLRETKKLTKK